MATFIQSNWTPDRPYCIYLHTTPTGKVYVGQTSSKYLSNRWKNGEGYNRSKHFWNAILKYGWNNIKHEILYEGLTKDEADELEIKLIAKYRELNKCYNLTEGGEDQHGLRHTPEARLKMSLAHKGRPSPKKGIPLTEEHKAKIGKANIGHICTPEHRAKISAALKGHGDRLTPEGRQRVRESLIGSTLSDETKAKISKTKLSKNLKGTLCYINNGIRNKHVPKTEVDEWLNNGWKMGIVPGSIKGRPRKNHIIKP